MKQRMVETEDHEPAGGPKRRFGNLALQTCCCYTAASAATLTTIYTTTIILLLLLQ